MQEIIIKNEYIELAKLLKLCDLISTGGEFKMVVDDWTITLNGEPVNQKGKKVYVGDTVIVETEDNTFEYKVCS